MNALTTLPLSMVVMVITPPPPSSLSLQDNPHSLKPFPSLQFSARKTLDVFCALITFTFDFCDISESRFQFQFNLAFNYLIDFNIHMLLVHYD